VQSHITGNSAVETATHDEGDHSKKDNRSDKTCNCRPNHDSSTNHSAFKELAPMKARSSKTAVTATAMNINLTMPKMFSS
jgi:hypothetical protein